MKEKRFLVADTESTGLGSKAFVFDFGYVIGNRRGKIFCERNFLIEEVLTNPKIMLGALFNRDWVKMMGGKIFRFYIPALNDSTIKMIKWREALEIMKDDIATYGVDVFCAYNLPFDMGAMNTTHNMVTDKKLSRAFDRFQLLDLYYFSCITVCRTKLYHDTARKYGKDSGWITPADNVRTNAEKVHAFLSGNHDFIENHTALDDAQIEYEILQRLLARKTPIPYDIIQHMPWRLAQKRKQSNSMFEL